MKLTAAFATLATLVAVASALPSSSTRDAESDSSSATTTTASSPSSPTQVPAMVLGKAAGVKDGIQKPRHQARIPVPMPTPCGRLYVQASDGSYSGFVSKTVDSSGSVFVVTDPSQALEVSYADHRLTPTNVNTPYLLGATFDGRFDVPPAGPGLNNFAGNSGNFAALSGTSDSAYGTPATSAGSTTYNGPNHGGHQNAIFTLDPQNSEILPTWINTDGSQHLSTFGVAQGPPPIPSANGPIYDRQLAVSQNIGTFNAKFGGYSARIFCVGTTGSVVPGLPLAQLEQQKF